MALAILKMLIRVCFCDVLEPAVYFSKCTVCAINLYYLQILAMNRDLEGKCTRKF